MRSPDISSAHVVNSHPHYSFSFLFFLFFFTPCLLFSQSPGPQSRLWGLPSNKLDFSSLSPSSLPDAASHGPYVSNSANNVMQDVDGTNPLFFVVDGNVYDKAGYLIGIIKTPADVVITGSSEWVIVPVPGSCSMYYLIAGKVADPYYIKLDLTQHPTYTGADANASGSLVDNSNASNDHATLMTGSTTGSSGASLQFAVTPLRTATNDRLLFFRDNSQVYKATITSSGISAFTLVDNIPDAHPTLGSRSEMEVIQLPDANGDPCTSCNYRVAAGYVIRHLCDPPNDDLLVVSGAVYVADFDLSGNLVANTTKVIFTPDPNPSANICYHGSTLLSCAVSGVELSKSGRFVYRSEEHTSE